MTFNWEIVRYAKASNFQQQFECKMTLIGSYLRQSGMRVNYYSWLTPCLRTRFAAEKFPVWGILWTFMDVTLSEEQRAFDRRQPRIVALPSNTVHPNEWCPSCTPNSLNYDHWLRSTTAVNYYLVDKLVSYWNTAKSKLNIMSLCYSPWS